MPGYDERPPQPILRQFGGLNTVVSEIGLPGNDSPSMENVDLHPAGSLKKRLGISQLDSPGVSPGLIRAVMLLDQPEDSRRWVYAIDENEAIQRTTDTGPWSWETPTHGSGYTIPEQKIYGRENARYNDGVTEYPSTIYLCRGDNVPLIILGQAAAAGDIVTMRTGVTGAGGNPGYPSTWTGDHFPKFCRLTNVGRGARMHYWGFPDAPNTVEYSELDVPWNLLETNFGGAPASTDGGYYDVALGDGDEIVSVVDMFSYKVIAKKKKIFIYTGDPGYDDWNLAAVFPVGFVSDRCWTKVGNDILFWSQDGPRSLSAVQEYGDLAQANAAVKIANSVTGITPDTYDRVCCYHDVPNMRVVWFVPRSGAASNDAAYVYYYTTGEWTFWTGDRCEMMDIMTINATGTQTQRIIGASYTSGLVLHDSGYTDLGENFEAEYITNWINMAGIADASRALWVDIFYGDGGSAVETSFQHDLNTDWSSLNRVIRSKGGTGTAWGRFKWGQAKWGVTGRSHRAWELDQLFNLIRLRFTSTTDRPFEVMGYNIEARQKGTR